MSEAEISQLPARRLDAYRKQLLSLEETPSSSDVEPAELEQLDPTLVYFKDDPRWDHLMNEVIQRLR